MLLNFLDDVLLLDFTLESLQSAFQRFTILDDNFSQPIHLLVWGRRILSQPLVKTQKDHFIPNTYPFSDETSSTGASILT
jgi:hypothetical protein